jgi:hypothetical protein
VGWVAICASLQDQEQQKAERYPFHTLILSTFQRSETGYLESFSLTGRPGGNENEFVS